MAYDKHQRYRLARMRAAGISPFIDSDTVRAHIAALTAAGYTTHRIAAAAGIHGTTIYRMLGTPTVSPTRVTRREVAERILAVRPADLAASTARYVDSTGTRRRLQALVALGWSQNQLSARAGLRQQRVPQILAEKLVHAETAAVVRDLYDTLWNQLPRADDHRSRISVNRARRYAAARGWAPPLAWDDDMIDDPAAQPAQGWRRRARGTPARERAADARELIRLGVPRDVIAERFAMEPKSLQTLLERHQEDSVDAA